MGFIVGEDREQASLLPSRIADYVASDAAVRVIDAFADGLDLAGLGFVRAPRHRRVGPAMIRVTF